MKLSNGVRLFVSEASLVLLLTVTNVVGKALDLTKRVITDDASYDTFSRVFDPILRDIAHSWLALVYLVWNIVVVALGAGIVKRIVKNQIDDTNA